ncbi:phytoene desaturase family protein [Nocardia terpenica]|uniref:phytoene desaturase family protein n=1 Tax=Nocardia terpenica TaxID=455432 RepID=UPI001E5A01E5|nr:NAD(P)/FAD-dependent oxidoreductase [Nocardia terpenica]
MAVIGTGPNGLAAAVTMARAGLRVELHEAAETIGGGLRTQPLLDRDIAHDICSAVHPMALASPFFEQFDLSRRGVAFATPRISYAHPLDDGRAGLAYRDLETTCTRLGGDGSRWRDLMAPLIEHSSGVAQLMLSGGQVLPRSPSAAFVLAPRILSHCTRLATRRYAGAEAKALFSGLAAHANGRLPSVVSAAVALLLGHLAHTTGWPIPRGGSTRIAAALVADIEAHGGTVHTANRIDDLRELADARVILCDLSPKEFVRIAKHELPARYVRRLGRFRYGPAAAKVDFLVNEPIPWTNPEVAHAGTVHLGGTQAETFRQETHTAAGIGTGAPFVLVSDPAVADLDRAHSGKRPVWAYAHVPNGDGVDPVPMVCRQIERYAPGFSETIIAARGICGAEYEAYNPNYVGGDIGAGAVTLRQALLRPTLRWGMHSTPLPHVYLCSASTPPGPGVHGMCGYLAAKLALRRRFGLSVPALAPGLSEAR